MSSACAAPASNTAAAIVVANFICLPFYCFNENATFLLLSKWPTPCDYAAKANPDGAKFSFAFSLIDLYAIIR